MNITFLLQLYDMCFIFMSLFSFLIVSCIDISRKRISAEPRPDKEVNDDSPIL